MGENGMVLRARRGIDGMLISPQAPRVVVVLLNWRNSQDTLACLDQLRAHTYPNWETIVIDNGSGDGSVEHIRAAYPAVQLITRAANHGFAGGINPGLQYAAASNASYALLLNSDIQIPPDLIETLVAAAEADPTIGVVGPKLYRLGHQPIYTMYGFRTTPAGIRPVGWGAIDTGQFDGRPIDAIPGCAMLLPLRTIQTVGLFDERFFFYYEDIDYCLRIAKAGLTVRVAPDAILRHEIGGSTRRRTYRRQFLLASGRMRFLAKHRRSFRMSLVLLNEIRETINQLRGAGQSGDLMAACGYLLGMTAACIAKGHN
jgi:GT2 family glycosyltransferase